jgi:hypothetical protein
VHQVAVILEPHRLAAVEHARATEPELDRADRAPGGGSAAGDGDWLTANGMKAGLPFPVTVSATHAPGVSGLRRAGGAGSEYERVAERG